jgi:hypothetical protein
VLSDIEWAKKGSVDKAVSSKSHKKFIYKQTIIKKSSNMFA